MSAQDTMKAQPFVVTPADYAPPLHVLGTKVTVLASNTATHAYEITLQQGNEGTGPPLHSHNWDESFYVIRGEVEFDNKLVAKVMHVMPDGVMYTSGWKGQG